MDLEVLTDGKNFALRLDSQKQASLVSIQRKSFPNRGKSKYKGPEAALGFAC